MSSVSVFQGGAGPKGEKGVQGPPGPPVSVACLSESGQ